MIFECKIYDKHGKLIGIHSAEELEERDRQICLGFLPDKNRKAIENFEGRENEAIQDEHRLVITYKTN